MVIFLKLFRLFEINKNTFSLKCKIYPLVLTLFYYVFFFSFYKHLTLSIGVRENKNGQKKEVIFVLEKKGF
jgi:hypothetical protein